jgi:hypothetical protein
VVHAGGALVFTTLPLRQRGGEEKQKEIEGRGTAVASTPSPMGHQPARSTSQQPPLGSELDREWETRKVEG